MNNDTDEVSIEMSDPSRAGLILPENTEVSDEDITADDLAYKRLETKFYNLQLAEQPNTDFGYIMARQFLMDVYNFYLFVR